MVSIHRKRSRVQLHSKSKICCETFSFANTLLLLQKKVQCHGAMMKFWEFDLEEFGNVSIYMMNVEAGDCEEVHKCILPIMSNWQNWIDLSVNWHVWVWESFWRNEKSLKKVDLFLMLLLQHVQHSGSTFVKVLYATIKKWKVATAITTNKGFIMGSGKHSGLQMRCRIWRVVKKGLTQVSADSIARFRRTACNFLRLR